MIYDSTPQDQREAFLASIKGNIDYALGQLILHKVHDMDLDQLSARYAYFDTLVDETWEEYDLPSDADIDAFKAATMEALADFKKYYDSLKTGREAEEYLIIKTRQPDFKEFLDSFLRTSLENRLSGVAESQALIFDFKADDPVKLVKLFNKAASELKKRLTEDYDPAALQSEDDIEATAKRYARIISDKRGFNDDQKIIVKHVIEAEATAALTSLNRRLSLGRGPRRPDEIKEICWKVRGDTLASLFDIAERTHMIPDDIRDLGTSELGFKPPQRQPV